MPDHPVYLWHYIAVIIGFILLGAFSHYFRAIVNFLPDRISDSKNLDMFVSGGYSFFDRIIGTEYDEAGYYRGDSAHNLKVCVITSFILGFTCLVFLPGFDNLLASFLDIGLDYLKQLFVFRLANTEIL